MNNKKTFLAILFLVALTVLVSALGSLVPAPQNEVTAQSTPTTPTALTGYAWSSNIGWIKFHGDGAWAGVKLQGINSGALDGYAWANPYDNVAQVNNIGWISFNPPNVSTQAPESPKQGARLESNGDVTGWARACLGAATPGSCSGGTNPDGSPWDGWIKMSGDWDNGVHKITLTDGSSGLAGFAWGGDVMGWISFSPKYPNADGGDCTGSTCPPCTGATCPPPGPCDPTKQVCIGGPDPSNSLWVTCEPVVNGEAVAQTLPGVPVEWTAYPLNSTGDPDYLWTPGNSSVNPNSITYLASDVGSTKTMRIDVTDDEGAAFNSCSVEVVSTLPEAVTTGGSLTVNDGGIIYISEQPSGHTADTIVNLSKPGISLTNDGDVAITGLKVVSITSTKTGSAALPSTYTCSFTDSINAPFTEVPCNSMGNLAAEGGEGFFRLRIPAYNKTIADNSPYKIVLQGQTSSTDENGNVTTLTPSANVIFRYLVGTYTPQ